MLEIKHVTEQSEELALISGLYERAFPGHERSPLNPLLRVPSGRGGIVSFFSGGIFCGFACLVAYGDIVHIIYFAVEEAFRNRGYGSEALWAMGEMNPGSRLIVDIEAETPGAPNNGQRRKRKQFYLRNGYAESEVRYSWRGELYEVLVSGGRISNEDFEEFWKGLAEENKSFTEY